MVHAALDRLEDDPQGFLLVVEAARIDHASHLNMTDRVHLETVELDQTVASVLARPRGGRNGHDGGGHRRSRMRWRSARPGWPVRSRRRPGGGRPHQHPGRRLRMGRNRGPCGGGGRPSERPRRHRVRPDRNPPQAPSPTGHVAVSTTSALRWSSRPGTRIMAGLLDALRIAADESGLWLGVDGVFNDNEHAVLAWISMSVPAPASEPISR